MAAIGTKHVYLLAKIGDRDPVEFGSFPLSINASSNAAGELRIEGDFDMQLADALEEMADQLRNSARRR